MPESHVVIENSTQWSKNVIGLFEKPKWQSGDFLRDRKLIPVPLIDEIVDKTFSGPSIPGEFVIKQNDPRSFTEFDELNSQYTSSQMRNEGCGSSTIYMVLSTLTDGELNKNFPTVGKFTQTILKDHKNDMRGLGVLLNKGTPVYNPKTGWYHDALVYEAKKTTGIGGHRFENIDFLDLAVDFVNILKSGKKPLAIVSVDSNMWFASRPADAANSGTHLLVVSGFRFSGDELTEICITDPYNTEKNDKVNTWVKCDKYMQDTFTGRAMVFEK